MLWGRCQENEGLSFLLAGSTVEVGLGEFTILKKMTINFFVCLFAGGGATILTMFQSRDTDDFGTSRTAIFHSTRSAILPSARGVPEYFSIFFLRSDFFSLFTLQIVCMEEKPHIYLVTNLN